MAEEGGDELTKVLDAAARGFHQRSERALVQLAIPLARTPTLI